MNIEKIPSVYEFTVYQWSTLLTWEQDYKQPFFWTQEARTLLKRLQRTDNQLIAVIGLQGSGKTALRKALSGQLDNCISEKWFGREDFLRRAEYYVDVDTHYSADEYLWLLSVRMGGDEKLLQWAERKLGNSTAWKISRCLEGDKIFGPSEKRRIVEAVKAKLGRGSARKKHEELLFDWLARQKNLLIDLPDYSKSSETQMNKDLRDIHSFWEELNQDYSRKVNLVVFCQKEMFKGHFYYGKFDVFEIRPFSPVEFYRFYMENFAAKMDKTLFNEQDQPVPFTREALMEIGRLSNGIFRRFKKYIRIALEKWYETTNPWVTPLPLITQEQVCQWITINQIEKDMELELMGLFPKSKENRRYSVILLSYLREHGPTDQKTLTQELFGDLYDSSKMACSRLLHKLEAHNYIKLQNRLAHGLKVWDLK